MTDNPFADGCAYIDGKYVPLREACIPILDMGFLRSDITYDVVAVWKGKFFRLEDHLDRFERGWRRLLMKPSVSKEEIRAILFECVRRSGIRNAYVSMTLSRGIDEERSRDPRRFRSRLYAYAMPYVWIASPELQETGIHLIVSERTIRIPPHAVDPTVKNYHWGDLTRGLLEAYDRGAYTVVLPDADGNITEGPGFNVFVYCGGALLTPERGVLEGITRQTVLDLAAELSIPARLATFNAKVLREANEVFVTSTAGGVIPVTKVDGRPVGLGEPGEITTLMRTRYWEAHDEGRWTTPVTYE
jgi:branched-chain amino acid aminotransferase